MRPSHTDKKYDSQIADPSVSSMAVKTTQVSLPLRQRLTRHALSTVVVVAFLAIGYIAIRQLFDGHLFVAFMAGSASLMCIPLVDHTSDFRQRLFASCLMPFAMAGLALFVMLYFKLFRIAWFERLFNDKGSGPVGMIFFALTGMVAGGYIGWRILTILGWREAGRTDPPEPRIPSDAT